MAKKDSKSFLFEKLQYLTGVGPARSRLLARMGLHIVYDLLFHLPRTYEDRRKVTPIRQVMEGEKAVISGYIFDVEFKKTKTGKRILDVYIADQTGSMTLTWFNARSSWADRFQKKDKITAYGKVQFYQGHQIVSPDYTIGEDDSGLSDKFGGILPIYPSTEGMSQKVLRRIVRTAVDNAADELVDIVPETLKKEKNFGDKSEALRHIHFPPKKEAAQKARRRLAYEELLLFQTALASQRKQIENSKGYSFKAGRNVEQRIRNLFPFNFTEAQNRVIRELQHDLRAGRPMHRLLQGDVGCGKTVIAVFAILSVLAESSKAYQTAFMAPTEVLAEQHYLTLEKMLAETNVKIMLLKGSAKQSERQEKLERIAKGEVDLVVGTHALIQKDVSFNNLALAVIDEQQRFGVEQRFDLTQKGRRPDILLMTATPIPRTLTLACFGDMDVSVIDEMPPQRQHVKTAWLLPNNWKAAYKSALKELQAGRRVFVIFPLVENNEEMQMTSATEAYDIVKNGIFKDFPCCLLHGRMSAEDKRKTMEGFRKDYQVMVATTVVEVGIDVPDATVMIIQHAERLGLSQLHQLRGRVGRDRYPGVCYLLGAPTTEEGNERLEVLTSTNDGFKIAEADLRLRGPGELFGTRQSGMPEFRCFDFSDLKLLNEVQKDAMRLLEEDPELAEPQNQLLKKALEQRYSEKFELGRIG